MSAAANAKYSAVHINSGTDKTLYFKADLKSKFKTDINPLVIPHPKQDMPKKFLNGHNDTWGKIFVKIKSTSNKTCHYA